MRSAQDKSKQVLHLLSNKRGGSEVADKRRNALLVPQAERAVNQMKEEIADEMHVNLGADTTARENGAVGGEMVKRMIQMAEGSIANQKK